MWGFITVIVDAFIPRLKDVFELSYLQAGLVQFAWFTAYGLLGIPGGLLIKKIGYQKGIIVALSICALGCLLFWPAAHFRVFGFFLSALFVLAGGITVLQVAANPYIAVLGEARLASSRLNLAQAINSFGTTIAPIFAATYLLSDTILSQDEQKALSETKLEAYRMAEAGAVKGPFLALAAVFGIIALFFLIQRLPKIINPEMFLKAMVKYGVSPKECVIVEDSHYGRQAAFDAGAHLCAVENAEESTAIAPVASTSIPPAVALISIASVPVPAESSFST